MRTALSQLALHGFFLLLLSFLIVMAMNPGVLLHLDFQTPAAQSVQSFKTMFVSIVLEALPFIVMGVIVSSFVHTFIPESWIRKFAPKHPLAGIAFACLLGFLFPVCECGMVPVIRRLIAKGMPLYIGVVFILVGPIVNPIVYGATFMAFRNRPELLYARMGLALLVGAAIGLIVYAFVKKNVMKHSAATLYGSAAEHQHAGGNRLYAMLEHAGAEFFDMGKYLIFGSVVAAAMQTFVPRASLLDIGQAPVLSHFFMMGLAYVLSLCSTSDAFVASSFVNTFSAGSLLTFMVFGPMMDLKTTLMLSSIFRLRFVLLLAVLVAVFVFVGASAAGQLIGR
ncbi:permease [Paenibacillus hodogayensis]|uniref:Permease n=1 Tax=Paenibacillus hodogayensis TaxID=279208 RepID=A0ABV5VZH1_9BACL